MHRRISITLTREDFATLVTGKVVTKDDNETDQTFELILEDIGFSTMDDLINRARAAAGTGEVIGPPLEPPPVDAEPLPDNG